VDTAIAAGSFKKLVDAVAKAGLVETLKGFGPFTVFAPTDEAFAKLPEGTLESLLKPENKKKLIDVLKFHVVPGRLTTADLQHLPITDTVQGTSLLFAKTSAGVTVDGVTVTRADILAANGVIHVIDRVLFPKDIFETVSQARQFNTLLTAAKAANLAEVLKKPDGNLTVFAPTDKAFEALQPGTLQDWLLPANSERLAAILKYHILPSRLLFTQDSVQTLQGGHVQIRSVGAVKVEQANIIVPDIKATNGVIHVIDSVLIPVLPEPTARQRGLTVLAEDEGPRMCTIVVEISGLRNSKGQILMNLFASSNGFPDNTKKAFRSAIVPIGKEPVIFELKNIPQNTYALALVHDEDMNSKLTTSLLGYPREGIGVSNNKFPPRGKPHFKDARFNADKERIRVGVIIKYYAK
jgi:uncharacterized surface protein with fasciclin (FAS1) repeats/uncharacterized protein (DUF2141 family)